MIRYVLAVDALENRWKWISHASNMTQFYFHSLHFHFSLVSHLILFFSFPEKFFHLLLFVIVPHHSVRSCFFFPFRTSFCVCVMHGFLIVGIFCLFDSIKFRFYLRWIFNRYLKSKLFSSPLLKGEPNTVWKTESSDNNSKQHIEKHKKKWRQTKRLFSNVSDATGFGNISYGTCTYISR